MKLLSASVVTQKSRFLCMIHAEKNEIAQLENRLSQLSLQKISNADQLSR